jgi:hypothetical protein
MASDNVRIDEEVRKLRENGFVAPRHTMRAAKSYADAYQTSRDLNIAAGRDLDGLSASLGRTITSDAYDSPEVQKMLSENEAKAKVMGDKRSLTRRMTRTANLGTGSPVGGDAYNAIPRFYDPLEYWDLAGIPWNVADEGHRHKLHKWMRLYYATHYLVPILIDIFTRFPLVGMELESKDPKLTEVYENIFFDNLKYEDFLVAMGREFWLCGEAFPLASFDEDLGVWEHEELLNPEDIVIDNFPMLNTQQLKVVPPDYLRRIAQTKSPAREWYMLQANFEELIPYLLKGQHIPISPVMLRQVANKLNHWDDHGTPILLRGLRTLLHEEKLLASQDAIAERLYSPFLLAKLGIMDMGDNQPPWLPSPAELEAVRDDLDIALSSDFRVMVHHFGLELTSVFGREQMPRLGDDFDRIERRLMQVFGVNPSLLSAGSNSQPYASSALQAEFMNQILRTFQKMLKDHFRERALVVAEAQEHFDYERKGETRVPVFEKVVIFDEEGNKEIKRVPKLLVPDLKFATFDLRDEATERQFLQSLRAMGVPIPSEDLMIGIDGKFEDMIKRTNKELEQQTIAQQEAKMKTYIALTVKGLPVPLDLKAECESVLVHGPGAGGGMPQGAGGSPMGGAGAPPGGPPGGPGAGPGGAPIVMPPPPSTLGPGPGTAPPGGGAPPTAPNQSGPPGTVPPVSNERRPGLTYNTSRVPVAQFRERTAADEESVFVRYAAEHPELGIPFQDYAEDFCHVEDVGLNDLTDEHIAQLEGDWPLQASSYQAAVLHEIVSRYEAMQDASDQSAEEEKESAKLSAEAKAYVEGELHLKDTQRLAKNEGQDAIEGFDGEEYILEEPKHRKPPKVASAEKKYAVLDPLAPDIDDDEESDESTEPEPAG